MLSFSFITGQVSHTASYTSIYHCLQVTTRCSSILSDRNVCFGCCQHCPLLSSFSSMWRSDGAQNENNNVWITEICSLRTMCLEWSATDFVCIIHHTWTVPEQTKDYFAWPMGCDLALSW